MELFWFLLLAALVLIAEWQTLAFLYRDRRRKSLKAKFDSIVSNFKDEKEER